MSVALSHPVGASRLGTSQDLSWDIHLDANANTAPTESVIASVVEALSSAGNPSTAHGAGEPARQILARARDAVAALVAGGLSENVVFTSGCTEANNQVVASANALQAHLVTTVVEHPSVLKPAEAFVGRGGSATLLPVDANGVVRLDALQAVLSEVDGPMVVSIQAVNSETGVCQPWDAIARLARRRPDTLLHADAAQAFGKLPLRLGEGGADVITLSGHKLHAPMGVGAMLFAEGESRLSPLLLGGDQESGLRAGTEPLPLIAGLGEACDHRKANFESEIARMAILRDTLEAGLLRGFPSARVNGSGAARSPNTCNVCFPGVDGTALVAMLDAEGVFASQGSACHSRRPEPSHVLRAMGMTEADAFASVRFSVSARNTLDEITAVIPLIVAAAQRLGGGA